MFYLFQMPPMPTFRRPPPPPHAAIDATPMLIRERYRAAAVYATRQDTPPLISYADRLPLMI